MRILILGGSGFLGRHVAADALARGWDVTTFNRGTTAPEPGVRPVTGDRERPADLAPLAHERWDAVVDTWSAAPRAVRDAAAALEPVASRYLYVSSVSVYAELAPRRAAGAGPADRGRLIDGTSLDDRHAPITRAVDHVTTTVGDTPGGGVDRSPGAAATVHADPDAATTDYAADKRGAELAAVRAFGPDRTLLARSGLLLGPGEDIGRLPWWLRRIARGGPTLAPGPPDLPLQSLDARDLAAFLLDHAAAGLAVPVDVVGPPTTTTTGELLATIGDAVGVRPDLRWLTPDAIAAAGIEPWTELPLYLPADHEAGGLLARDDTHARSTGLRARPVAETVADTWAWLQAVGDAPQRPDRPPVGLDAERERLAISGRTDGDAEDRSRGSSSRP